jgi:hypothetical protein
MATPVLLPGNRFRCIAAAGIGSARGFHFCLHREYDFADSDE